ncbi:MAG: DNA-processing protein DprA [Candidatus Omnitrophota bacterium]|jgi:DNA processing protein
MNDFEALVSLNLIPFLGGVSLKRLRERFGRPAEIFKASFAALSETVGERSARGIANFDTRILKEDLSLAKDAGVGIVTIEDGDYPLILKEIPSPPVVIYFRGRLGGNDCISIGIVGSRRASFYGLSSAENFAAALSRQGFTIVSGLARGADTYAHRGALKAGGRTIAVMGSGFSNIYPPENTELARRISSCGAVISEFPMKTLPLPQNFPRRNRLISGLSCGILVTEAAKNSGALITADFALEQGREVFALPGRIDSAGSDGTNNLIKQGAKLVTCLEDILEGLGGFFPEERKIFSEEIKSTASGDPEEKILYGQIGRLPVGVDELVEKTSLESSRILGLVLRLRLKKLIRALPGKYYIRS